MQKTEIKEIISNVHLNELDKIELIDSKINSSKSLAYYQSFLFGLFLFTIFGGFYMLKCKPDQTEFKRYKHDLDSIYQMKMDSVSSFVNCVPNESILKAKN